MKQTQRLTGEGNSGHDRQDSGLASGDRLLSSSQNSGAGAQNPQGPAVQTADHLLTQAQVNERSQDLARQLASHGLVPGQLVLSPVRDPSAELTILQRALWLSQVALMPFAADLDAPSWRALARQTGAEWCWETAGSRPDQRMSLGQLVKTESRSDHSKAPNRSQPSAADTLALVVQTSGSSGGFKAAMLTRSAVEASCRRINARLELSSGDLWLCCLPRQHIGGLSIGYRCGFAGATMLLHYGFDAALLAADLWRHPVTHLSLVPPMLARLLDRCPEPPPWLRVVLMGGQSLNVELARRAVDSGWPLHLGYGMTETCSFVASRRLGSGADRGLSPLPGVSLDCPGCAHPDTAATARLRIQGPMLMAGYANPARTPGVGLDCDGWLTTGDLACLDQHGCVRVLGRADDRVVIAGVNVLPADVESRLGELPGIAQCAVCALPEPVWGHTLVALYQGSLSVDALAARCRDLLPSSHRPRLFVLVDQWPLGPSGKSDRMRLRELAEAARGR